VPALVGDGDDPAGLRLAPGLTFLLDEPEAALSVRGCMALVARIEGHLE
jgi:predicted ATPase